MESFIDVVYEKYNKHVYLKPAFPLVYMLLYMFYYYTMISPVYSLRDRIAEVINPFSAVPYITGAFMLFITLMYSGICLKAVYFVMYVFAVGFSAVTTFKLCGTISVIDYIPFVVLAGINIALYVVLERYRRKE